jgi:ferredoxin
MKVRIDEDLCIACGVCVDLVPDVFALEDEPWAEVIVETVPEDLEDDVRDSAEECPTEAIIIEE